VTGEDKKEIVTPNVLTYVELANIVSRLHKVLNFTSVRLTGGEPLLYSYIIPFIELLSVKGIENIKLTTNGFLLKQKAKILALSGLNHINISLDALTPQTFAAMARRDCLQQVLEGIDAAIEYGLTVKINSVIMRGVNDGEILPLLNFAITKNISLRYLELMRMGHFYSKDFDQYYFPMKEILDVIRTQHLVQDFYREPSATAHCWSLDNGYEFGIIANESEPFCSDCDRLRLDNAGNIYGCLSEDKREYIADIITDEKLLAKKLQTTLTHKQPLKFKGSAMTMIAIGG
jgi:cyclic pyranopterin phosphate synthase